jgi:chromate transporter
VLGVIANLAVWCALHLWFESFDQVALPFGGSISAPHWNTLDFLSVGPCALALLALFRFKVGVVTLVLAAAASGIALQVVGLLG